MSNENDHPDSQKSNSKIVLPGGLPDVKPAQVYKPPVRQPQALSNADDIAAIHNSHARSRNIESIVASLQRLLVENPSYVEVTSEFLSKLAEEIENPTGGDSVA